MNIRRNTYGAIVGAATAAGLFGGALAIGAQVFDPTRSGDAFTVDRADRDAYFQPAPVLDYHQKQIFFAGRGHFSRRWVVFAANGEWGLGPTFVSDRCSLCHERAGRGAPPEFVDEQLLSMVVRVSVDGKDEHGGPKPHPHYGGQLQNRALQGQSIEYAYSGLPVPQEADLYLGWKEETMTLADGERVSLRVPDLRIENVAFGVLDGTMTSLRIAPPVFGLGLLEAISEKTIYAIAQQQKIIGFNGRPNHVRDDINKRMALGRFGWKANQPTLKQQIAAAAIADMGVTSDVYIKQNCPPIQTVCQTQVPGGVRELIDIDWEQFEFWLRGLGVPARRNVSDRKFLRGEQLFVQAQCAVCHVPEVTTADEFPAFPALANQTIRPYTDLLLHDMGEALADGRPDFQAGPRDWRTPPLWGLGLSKIVNGSTALLHDGRARNVTEAILWHGGEAQVSRDAFVSMSREDRDALVRFVESI
jgi:CxxC motif-containing protein (DUF1111 family)